MHFEVVRDEEANCDLSGCLCMKAHLTMLVYHTETPM